MVRGDISRRDALKYGAAVTAAGLAGCSEGGSLGDAGGSDVIELIWADWFPEATATLDYTSRKFMDTIEAESDGRVRFDYRPGGQVGGATELMDLLAENAVDCAHISPSYYTDRLPLTQVGMLPGLLEGAPLTVGSQASYDLLTPHRNGILFENEWEQYGIRPLLPVEVEPYQVSTVDAPVEAMEDFEGLKLRSSGGIADLTGQALGASPVMVTGGEIYQSLERGTIDGDMTSIVQMDIFDTYEVVDHVTSNAQLHTSVLVEAINLDVWNDLPDDVRELFIREADKIPTYHGPWQMGYVQTLLRRFERNYDLNVYELPPAMLDEMNAALRTDVVEPWVSNRSDPELAQQVVDAYRARVEEYS